MCLLWYCFGVFIDIRSLPRLPPVIRLAEDRYWKLIRSLHSILDSSALGPALAGQLFGQFGFSCSQFFGRWGRAKLRPFSRRQHEAYRFALNPQLLESIDWWLSNLHRAPPRPVFSFKRGHVHLGHF